VRVSLAIPIEDESRVGETRRAARGLATAIGFDESDVGRVALAATEMATNIVKHAGAGELVMRRIDELGARGIEMLALDRGRGIRNIAESLRDGYSTAGSPGTGLGALARLADTFDLYSLPDAGTAMMVRVWLDPPSDPGARFPLGVINVSRPGETVCGDSWSVEQAGDRTLALVVDGLGHGDRAAEAAHEAVRVFAAHRAGSSLPDLMSRTDDALRKTRGAAVGLAEIDHGRRVVRFVGVGNIAGTIVTPNPGARHRNVVSLNGTVGAGIRKVQEFCYPCEEGALLILYSDGLRSLWALDPYPGLLQRDPALIAGVLYRDSRRQRDDVTVLVLRTDGG
jgi:anti-sigma regulatory factor (Ser/Thr protein kinase)